MAREQPQINIRIPQAIRDQLEEARAKAGRSLTAEIVARLEWSFAPQRAAEIDGQLESIHAAIWQMQRMLELQAAKEAGTAPPVAPPLTDAHQTLLSKRRKR